MNERLLFTVQGQVDGVPVERCVGSCEEAERLAQTIELAGSESWASWMLVPADDSDEPVWMFGRLRRGLAGESRRVVHIFGFVPERLLARNVQAVCGVAMRRVDVELGLSLGTGMPCERCLLTAPDLRSSAPSLPKRVRGELPAGEPVAAPADRDLLQRVLAGLRQLPT